MSRLFVFGCSYSEDYKQLYDSLIASEGTVLEKYKTYRGGKLPDSWGYILAQRLGLEYSNYAEGAAGNHQILHQFCEHIHEIQEGDIVVIGWSFMGRYRWADDRGEEKHNWRKMGPGPNTKWDVISQITHEEICYNRTSYLYIDEIYNYINMMDEFAKSKKCEIYYWSGDRDIIYDLPVIKKMKKKFLCSNIVARKTIVFDNIYKMGGETIKDETNGVIDDLHMGESGHRIQADLFYKHITDFKMSFL